MSNLSNADRAARIVADSRAYLAKPRTSNLSDFAAFAAVVADPILSDAGLSKADRAVVVDLASKIAGTYSRYQDAKRAGLVPTILAPAPKARAPRAPKAKAADATPASE